MYTPKDNDNLFLIRDIIDHANITNEAAYIITIDQMKFNWKFVNKILNRFQLEEPMQ